MGRWARRSIGPFYSTLAWAYDPGAWLLTCGLYHRWTFAAEGFIHDQPVLDVGCGSGRLLARLAEQGHEVTGVDKSPQMASIARRRLRRAGLPGEVICTDARSLPMPDESVGTIINAFPMPYVNEEATWAEYLRVLRPGGRWIVVSGPHPQLDRFHPRLLGWYLLLLAEFGRSLGRRRRGTTVPLELFPKQQGELVQVGPTRAVVHVLEKANPQLGS